ncbi:MAG: hypothetical protein ACOC04_06110 [Halothece sp.]
MGNICIIGPRASGKTTYLAALAYCQDKRQRQARTKIYNIQPLNEEAKQLTAQSENIIQQGLSFEPNIVGDKIKTPDDLHYYSFMIEVKNTLLSKPERFQLNAKDYPGEVFEDITKHKDFIDECLMKDVVGCLILFTGWEKGEDSSYYQLMSKFIDAMNNENRIQDLRLAVAMSKCERGEIWPGRLDPETDLFGVHLPKTLKTLKDKILRKNLRFYAMSTFGVLGRNNPRPNRIDRGGKESVLRDAAKWRPYNLVEPLYWLSKG